MEETAHPSTTNPIPTALPKLDDEHTPAVSSPLNPDAKSRTRTREQREKKATLKKRELADGEPQGPSKKIKAVDKDTSVISPIRYRLPSPKLSDLEPPKAPTLIPTSEKAGRQFHESSEHVYNRKGFRYSNAIVDPVFPSSRYNRATEVEPYSSRIDFKDAGSHVVFDEGMMAMSTEKGFRMARANVGAREGRYYWECKILSGVKADPLEKEASDGGGHVRVGWARREASLEGPVGFDAYSYGLRDIAGQKVHMSRPKDFADADLCEGDVIGLEITLPSLSLHRKVVEGVYNKAVDVSDDLDPIASGEFLDVIRDRVPIRFKTQLYFEHFEYQPVKILEDFMNPSPPAIVTTTTPATTDPPNPNHPEPCMRTLPFSSIKIYKNGELLGTPYTDLLAFLPPASKPLNQLGARDGLDDGTLGYYPALSAFRGGAVEANLGPNFWYPPPDLTASEDLEMIDSINTSINPATNKHILGAQSKLRPISERFNEQIAEDVTIDIIDEVDFWAQDGDDTEGAAKGANDQAPPSVLGPVDPQAPELVAATAEAGDEVLVDATGIREIIQEED